MSLRCLRSEEHTSELQSRPHLVCRLLLEKVLDFKYGKPVLNSKWEIKPEKPFIVSYDELVENGGLK